MDQTRDLVPVTEGYSKVLRIRRSGGRRSLVETLIRTE